MAYRFYGPRGVLMFRSDLRLLAAGCIFSWGVESWEEDLWNAAASCSRSMWPGGGDASSPKLNQDCQGYNDAYRSVRTGPRPRKNGYPDLALRMPTPCSAIPEVTYRRSPCGSGFLSSPRALMAPLRSLPRFQETGP